MSRDGQGQPITDLVNDTYGGDMRIRKGVLVLAAVALPLASVTMLEGTAFAKKVTGSGTTSCHFGGTINFNPPLSAAGTPGVRKEITTVSATLGSCSGGTPVGSATSVAVKPIKTKVAKGANAGTCSSFSSAAGTTVVKVKVNWNGEKPSKFTVSGLHVSINGMGEAGFTASFPVSGSYAGSGNLAVYLTQASSTQIATCSGSISTLQIDSTQSTSNL
jgi:hypothetical protein